MNGIERGRSAIFDAIKPLLDDGRVHEYTPDQVVSPCIWIGYPRVSTRLQGRGSTFIVCTFTITIVVDGANAQQRVLLDQLTGSAWDAVEMVPNATPVVSTPRVIDIGGPNATGQDIDVEYAVTARTLCPPLVAANERNNGHG